MKSVKLSEYCQKFGTEVKRIREDKGLTLPEFSDQSDLPVYYIEQVEAGETSSSYFARRKMSKALNVDLEPIATRLYDELNLTVKSGK